MGRFWLTVLVPLLLPTADAFSPSGSFNVFQAAGTASSTANSCVRSSSFAHASSRLPGLGLRSLRTPALRRSRALVLNMAEDLVVEDGDVVGVRYKGTLDDGSVFDENPEGPLLEFEVGSGRVISGFDEAVRGLKVGESKTVTCEPKNAYGEYDEKNIAKVPRTQMPDPPEGMDLAPGLVLQLTTGQIAVVKEVGEDEVTLDGNHPLAGKRLTFSVELKEIKDRAAVVKDKVAEMKTILKNPVMGMLASEVTKNPNFLSEIEEKIDGAKPDEQGKVLNDILKSEEWTTITAALMSNPQLQQIMQDPGAMAKMQMQMQEQEAAEAGAGKGKAAGPEVPQAEFEDDK